MILKVTLLIAAISLLVISAGAQKPDVRIPDSPLGKIFQEWFEAINGDADGALKNFAETKFSTAALRQETAEKRLAVFRKLLRQSGGLEIISVTPPAGVMPMLVIARSRRGDHFLRIGIGIDSREPDKLSGLGFDKISNPNEKSLFSSSPRMLSEEEMISIVGKEIARRAAHKEFSGVILVAKDDRILLHEAYGFADVESKIKNSRKTEYHLASVGKMFTAVAIGQLVKAGKISFEDTVGKILPDFPNGEIKKITLHQLLTHTAGMGTYFESPGIKPGYVYANSTEEIEVYKDEELFFAPGARWRYSNAGFSLLGAIIERASGKNYHEYVQKNIFEPLGIRDNSTGKSSLPAYHYVQSPDDPLGIEPYQPIADVIIDKIGTGFGGGYASAEDLFKFVRAYRTGELLGEAMTETIAAGKVFESPGSPRLWGYGIREQTINGEIVRGHSGGGRVDVQMLWTSGYTVIIQTNVSPPTAASISGKIIEFITRQNALRNEKPDRKAEQIERKDSRNDRPAIEFASIPAGKFLMGSDEKDWRDAFAAMKDDMGAAKEEWFANQSPRHTVKITQAFEIGKFEITQGQWQRVMGTNLSQQRDKLNPQRKLYGEGDKHPIYYVSWEEANEFCRRLNELDDGYEYRLPTEAEWEYAARAGTNGDDAGDLSEIAWFGDNSGAKNVNALELWRKDPKNFFKSLADNGGQTRPVGEKKPNAWGLFDMQGNVWEWCAEPFRLYDGAETSRPAGQTIAERRVLRGASWDDASAFTRVAHRLPAPPEARYPAAGFRVVRQLKALKAQAERGEKE